MTLLLPFASILSTMTKHFPVEFSVSAGGCVYGALLLLLLPLKLVICVCLAAAVHEFCHILMLQICRVPIRSIRLGMGGAMIQTIPLSPMQELLCAAAGPAGSLLCLLLLRIFPLFALCGLLQGLYNLLPIYPLDGGRILQSLCLCCFPKHTIFICKTARILTIALIIGLSCYLAWQLRDDFYLLFAAYFLFRTRPERKIPCKEWQY